MIKAKPISTLGSSFDLTALIDIIFIVVVFLLLTANTQLLSVTVDIPESDTAEQLALNTDQTITLSLKATAPFWAINKTTYDNWSEFKEALLPVLVSGPSDRQFNIAADKKAAVEPLINLLSLLNEQGVTNTQILVEQKP